MDLLNATAPVKSDEILARHTGRYQILISRHWLVGDGDEAVDECLEEEIDGTLAEAVAALARPIPMEPNRLLVDVELFVFVRREGWRAIARVVDPRDGVDGDWTWSFEGEVEWALKNAAAAA